MTALRNFIRRLANRVKKKLPRKKARSEKLTLDEESKHEAHVPRSRKLAMTKKTRVSIREINDKIPQEPRDESWLFLRECRKCSSPLPFDTTETYVAKSCQGHCKCRTCKKCTMKHLRYKGKVDELIRTECCREGRLFDLWVALGDFDQEEIKNRLAERKSTSKTSLPINEVPKTSDSGIGYASARGRSTTLKYKEVDTTAYEDYLEDVIKIVIYSLPHVSTKNEDQHSSIMALKLLQTSLFLDKVSSLVRNDSVVDITNRRYLYEAVFGFIQELIGDPVLCKLLTEQRPDTTKSVGVLASSHLLKNPDYNSDHGGATSSSLMDCCTNTYRQAKAFLIVSGRQINEDKWSDRHVTEICKLIVQVYEAIPKPEKEHNSRPKKKDSDTKMLWKAFMDENKVTFSDAVLKDHKYKQKFDKENTSAVRNRLGTIGKEIANMSTSLPDGLFVKVAESRSDVMKVLIVGVEGTPYAGGLFTFDLYLDKRYPITPPQMTFVLENVNDDRSFTPINPNLHYGSGTVCLSILNTWQGSKDQQWQAHKSTILSVLVSIQAMILGAPHPYLNEPGRESHDPTLPVALEYSRTVQSKVVRYAMIPWLMKLKTDAGKKDIWADVSAMYWKCNGKSVVETVREWTLNNQELNSIFKDEYKPFPTLEKLVEEL